ncbi:ornithine cyclodeaminase [Actinoplanes italicus]|uniref:Ornithine cyclodeaminase n=1 Tax=Actinoplanes italicus TaxID=113567 RepID=A0A2T0JPA3_9ACTN|nr:ornithine cyclodeaminase family protein [Actinoplanes italicus]PRX09466.1 ornithine cyclodeaminase [Actinoplanes italicus]GIE36342.1 ornithine cyclodeaminase [Actinoplanes italicus]
MLVLSAADVHALLTPDSCRELMREALTALADDRVFLPLRTVVRPPRLNGLIALMPTHLFGENPAFGMKSVCVFPDNPRSGKDAHQGVVTLFAPGTGEPLAVINAAAVTEIRTAAVSALATAVLARPDARVLTVFGNGTQARAHLRALAGSFEEVRTVTRSTADPAAACAGADVIVTATTATDPILFAEWVEPGTHVNAVGSSIPTAAELDPYLLAKSVLFADRRESLLNESGDYLRAAHLIGPGHVRGELGEVLTGRAPGRTAPGEITVFKSLGLAIEDVVVARHLYERARSSGRGSDVPF